MGSISINVLDLPFLKSQPSFSTLRNTLESLTLSPSTWSYTTSHAVPENTPATSRYLTAILKNPFEWLLDNPDGMSADEQRDALWELASQRLTERCGRTAQREISRTWTLPATSHQQYPIDITIREPSLTGDDLGLKTWGTAWAIAQILPELKRKYFSHLFPDNVSDQYQGGEAVGSKESRHGELTNGTTTNTNKAFPNPSTATNKISTATNTTANANGRSFSPTDTASTTSQKLPGISHHPLTDGTSRTTRDQGSMILKEMSTDISHATGNPTPTTDYDTRLDTAASEVSPLNLQSSSDGAAIPTPRSDTRLPSAASSASRNPNRTSPQGLESNTNRAAAATATATSTPSPRTRHPPHEPQSTSPADPNSLPPAHGERASTPIVLELGSGTGLLGLSTALTLQSSVLLTDLPAIVSNLHHNIASNQAILEAHGVCVEAQVLDWSDNEDSGNDAVQVPLIVVSDPIYDVSHPPLLARTITRHLLPDPSSRVLLAVPLRDENTRDMLRDLRGLLRHDGFELLAEGKEICRDDWGTQDSEQNSSEDGEVRCWWGVYRLESERWKFAV